MKKALLVYSLIISSVFFVAAQFNVGGVNVNVGKVCGTIDGKPACVNPSTGQWEIVTGNGVGVGGNYTTGQVGGAGTVGGVRIGGSFGGNGASNGVSGSGLPVQQNYTGVLGLIALAQNIAARLVPILITVALLTFFWFLIEFIWKGKDSPDEQAKGKKGMMFSIIALFVMVSIWGIIGFLGSILGVNQGGTMHGFILPGETK